MSEVDRIYARLGEFTVMLSKLDIGMQQLLGAVLGVDVNTARALYNSQNTTAARRDMVSAACQALGEADRTKVEDMLRQHASVFARRNRYMHDHWTFDPGAGAFRLQNERKSSRGPTTSDFKKFLETAMPIVSPENIERDIGCANTIFWDMVNFSADLWARRQSSGSGA